LSKLANNVSDMASISDWNKISAIKEEASRETGHRLRFHKLLLFTISLYFKNSFL
jgi:hypothetical protein